MGYKVRRIVIDICEDCLKGKGEMCHTPECAFCRHSVDIPVAYGNLDNDPQIFETKQIFEYGDNGELVKAWVLDEKTKEG
jgi:hypothetical protein